MLKSVTCFLHFYFSRNIWATYASLQKAQCCVVFICNNIGILCSVTKATRIQQVFDTWSFFQTKPGFKFNDWAHAFAAEKWISIGSDLIQGQLWLCLNFPPLFLHTIAITLALEDGGTQRMRIWHKIEFISYEHYSQEATVWYSALKKSFMVWEPYIRYDRTFWYFLAPPPSFMRSDRKW